MNAAKVETKKKEILKQNIFEHFSFNLIGFSRMLYTRQILIQVN